MSWDERPENWGMPGHFNRSEEFEKVLDQISSLTAPTWVSFTPVLTGSVTNPTNNSGTGRYRKSAYSDWFIAEMDITFSGAGGGTGFYIVSLPFTVTAGTAVRGFGSGLDFGTIERPFTTKKQSTSSVYIISDGGAVTATNPWTWVANDTINLTVIGEPA